MGAQSAKLMNSIQAYAQETGRNAEGELFAPFGENQISCRTWSPKTSDLARDAVFAGVLAPCDFGGVPKAYVSKIARGETLFKEYFGTRLTKALVEVGRGW